MDVQGSRNPFEIVGSGFCIDSSGIVVTCAHVLEAFMSKPMRQQIAEMALEEHNKNQPIHVTGLKSQFEVVRPYVVFYDTEASREGLIALPVPVEHVMAKTNFDIGMVRVLKHGYFPNGYPTLDVEEFEDISEGDEIAVCGFPLGMLLQEQLGTVSSSFSRGIVSSIIPAPGVSVENCRGFQLNVAVTSGNSGGPVFGLGTGRALGVLSAGPVHPTGGVVAGLAKAEPIYPLLEHDGVERMKAAPAKYVPGGPLP